MPSSSVLAWTRLSTGPNISVVESALVAGTFSSSGGFRKFPAVGIPLPERPSTNTFAPSSTPQAINPSMRFLLSGVVTGPIWTFSSSPFPTRSVLAIFAISWVNSPCALPTVTATEMAKQRCPAHPNALSLVNVSISPGTTTSKIDAAVSIGETLDPLGLSLAGATYK
jgi:hypothetical protein